MPSKRLTKAQKLEAQRTEERITWLNNMARAKALRADFEAARDYYAFVNYNADREVGATMAGVGLFVLLLFVELVLLYAITGAA